MSRWEHRFKAMGGPCCVRLDCEDESIASVAIAAAEQAVARLEQKYSRYLDTSITAAINRGAGSGVRTAIDAETAGLLRYAETLWQQSGGLFDLTSGVLRRVWDFRSNRLPDEIQLARQRSLLGWEKFEWSDTTAYLSAAGMEIDFGGCVKEYAADAAASAVQSAGVPHALVDLAGDLAVTGPQASGEPWPVGIRSPQNAQRALATIALAVGGLASSGDYQRCMVVDGQRYSHILNPLTGWPVRGGLAAVSVLGEQCLVAGSAATIAMLKTESDALDWLAQLGLPWLAVTAQGECHGTIAEYTPSEISAP